MQSMTWQKFVLPTVLAGLAAGIAGCGSIRSKASSDSHQGSEATFPDAARASVPEGIFVNIENLRKIAPGMTKRQLYVLLGAPHFSEGVFGVHQWNYILDFRKSGGSGDYFSCQYQIVFDKNSQAENFYWKPESCASVLAKPMPEQAALPVAMPAEPIRLSSDALFDFDRADLTAPGREQLSRLLMQVQSASQIQNILIVGYTDRIGSNSYNLTLSRRRAESVRSFLAGEGVRADAIQVEGRGAANPVVQCPDAHRAALIACLAPNRRVELSGMARP
jgi:outer membrane protein OmpA-like peptidoglycan-associated protein